VKRTDIVDYELTDSEHSIVHGTVSKGTSVPVIVVAVNEEAGTFSGFAFLPNGQTEYLANVAIPDSEPEPEATPEVTPEVAPEAPPQSDNVATANSEGSNAQ